MQLWDIKAWLYLWGRRLFPFGYILRRENVKLSALLQKSACTKGSRILDIGTGTGNTASLLPQGALLFAVDRSMEMVKRARKKIYGNFVVGDALALPYKSAVFDLSVAIGIFEYIRNRKEFVQELCRVTKFGGLAVVTCSPPKFLTALRNLLGTRIYPSDPHEFKRLMRRFGLFTIDEKETLLQRQYLLIKRGLQQ